MDIANYLSELLGQLGEVNVPGLGNFKSLKINGCYNDSEGRFYPPANDVRFSSNFGDDDILAEYIAEKKKISLASSKYFIEKYVNNLKQDAIQKDVPLAGLGWMRFSVHEIGFKSAGASTNGPAFFGYPQIELKKLGNTSFLHQMEALIQSSKDDILAVPVSAEETPKEPELPVIKQDETDALSAEETVNEPEIPVNREDETEALPAEKPVEEPELPVAQQEELPAADLPEEQTEEPKLPLAQAEETTEHEVAHEKPLAENGTPEIHHEETAPVALPYEPVTEQEPLEFDLEAYLQELETAAGIATPEPAKLPAETETTINEPPVDISEAEPEAGIPVPEDLPLTVLQLPGHGMDVPLPEPAEEANKPVAELQEYIPEPAPPEPQSQAYIPPVIPFVAAMPQAEEDFVFDGKGYDDVDRRKSDTSYAWLWITLIIIILLAGAGGYAWYRHRQSVLNMIKANAVPVPVKAPIKTDTVKTQPSVSLKDSARTAVIEDTTQKAVTAPISAGAIDSTKTRYELVSVSVPTIVAANRCVINYKSLGIADAHVLIPGPGMGRLIKVSLGTFNVRLDAIHKKRELLKTGNIREITILKINPKK